MTTYNVFQETLIATPHLTPSQATANAAVIFTGTSPYSFEPYAAQAAGLVVGNTYHVELVISGFGNPMISLTETTTIPTDASGNGLKRPFFDMYMFTLAA
jgi:hypothetical protein